jgi:hypothetical protein
LHNLSLPDSALQHVVMRVVGTMGEISDTDIERSREDPRFKQVLLARSLEQLLDSLHRMQHAPELAATDAAHLREGALVAVDLADRIRAIDEQLSRAGKVR